MFVRRRPLMRAAVIGGGAYMIGKNKGQQQAESDNAQSGSQSATAPAAAAAPASPAGSSVTDQLNRLTGLHQQGALNDGEFAAAKAKLLGT
jgi:hypothetical protein